MRFNSIIRVTSYHFLYNYYVLSRGVCLLKRKDLRFLGWANSNYGVVLTFVDKTVYSIVVWVVYKPIYNIGAGHNILLTCLGMIYLRTITKLYLGILIVFFDFIEVPLIKDTLLFTKVII